MFHFPCKPPQAAVLLFAFVLTAVLLSSCGNETPTICDTEGLGVLEGYVYECGEGVSTDVSARFLEGPQSFRSAHQTVSDSTGWYHLELPSGLYELEVDPNGLNISSSEYFDRIRVLPRVFRFDLHRGRAEVRIGLPDDLDGARFRVDLTNDDHDRVHEWVEAENGQLLVPFRLLVPGSYALRLDGGDLMGARYFPNALEFEDGDRMVVGTLTPAVYEIDLRDSYASISGSITGSWQLADGGWRPSVTAYGEDGLRLGSQGVDSDGTFTCGFAFPRKVRLAAENRSINQWFGGDSLENATVFDLQPGDRITGVDLVESGIRLQLDGPGDRSFHQPDVTLRSESGMELDAGTSFGSPVWINNLPAGRYYLHVDGFCEDEPWASQWYGGSESFAGAVPIDLAEGALVSVLMDLVEGGRVSGTLLRADGTTPSRVDFGLHDAEGGVLCGGYDQWRGFDNGAFRFQGLADGAYYLAAQLKYDEPWWYPGTLNFDEAEPIVIENHAAVTGLDWRLP